MARKYKFHRWYAVLWYNRTLQRFYYDSHMTKKEAKAKFAELLKEPE